MNFVKSSPGNTTFGGAPNATPPSGGGGNTAGTGGRVDTAAILKWKSDVVCCYKEAKGKDQRGGGGEIENGE